MKFFLVLIAFTGSAYAALIPPKVPSKNPGKAAVKVTEQLGLIRKRVMSLEQDLVNGLHESAQAKLNIKKIQALLKLQKEEHQLGEKRSAELESTVQELESRKAALDLKIIEQRDAIRNSLIAVEHSESTDAIQTPEHEKWEAPRRKVLAALVERGVREIEALRIDLDDADRLEQTINEEKQQLTFMLHDLDEQTGILKLNQELQVDLIKKRHDQRFAQLENYQKLKKAESQVEDLITNFNSRVELEKATEQERQSSRVALEEKNMKESLFGRLRGKLSLPVSGGKILTHYGRVFDAHSGLYVFKKGVEIQTDKNQAVHAISGGRVAFVGDLPDYGRVTIIDHGDHFYSLCAHMGANSKKTGDSVTTGDLIGQTDDSGTPVYFEIRARNVAVNPLQWISN